MADIQSAMRIGEERKERKIEERRNHKPQGKNIVVCPIP